MNFKSSILPEELEKLPLASFPGKIHVIQRPGVAYLRAIEYLRHQSVIGFDTETRPVFSPGQHHNKVALLQLSGSDEAFLFRLNKMGLHHRLCRILSDPKILKIGAATLDDVRGLQKRASFKADGFVDLQKLVDKWGIMDKSVKKMAGIIMNCRISKAQQLSNWEAEQLSDSQQKYAATDAWICREMYLKLLQNPTSSGNGCCE